MNNRFFSLCPLTIANINSTITNSTAIIIDASTEKIGWKYIASTTSPITDIDLRLNVAWTGTPASFKIGIFTSLNEAPSTTQLGGYTPTFQAPTSAAWTGLQTLASNTGNLTIGQTYWIVLEYVSGTIGANDYVQAQRYFTSFTGGRVRHYNGTNWTTTGTTFSDLFILKHNDNSYSGGSPITANIAATSQSDIFVNGANNQVQGIVFKTGSQVKIQGIFFMITKTGSPNDLVITVYEGNTSKYSGTITVTDVVSGVNMCIFSSPVLLSADTNIYIIFSQTGTSDSNDYDIRTCTINSTYIETIMPSSFRFVYGNLTTPSALSIATGEVPAIAPLLLDVSIDLDMVEGRTWGGIR